ncbi:MAG: M28 family peptidase [Myxococcota bacterium]
MGRWWCVVLFVAWAGCASERPVHKSSPSSPPSSSPLPREAPPHHPAFPAPVLAPASGEDALRADEILQDIRYLADDAREGRGLGTRGLEEATDYVVRAWSSLGLQPAGTSGYLQPIEVTTGIRLGPSNKLVVEGQAYLLGEDFTPHGSSVDGDVRAEVVFAGHGITAPELGYDDYASVDVRNRIALVMTSVPLAEDPHSIFNVRASRGYREVHYKLMNAREHGARAVLLVPAPTSPQGRHGTLPRRTPAPRLESSGLLAAEITTGMADALLGAPGQLRHQWGVVEAHGRPASRHTGVTARLVVELVRTKGTVNNVVALLPGAHPVLRGEAVVIGAHVDHLGDGALHAVQPDVMGTTHNGADDNASGTAGLLALARAFAKGPRPLRSVVFVAFTGEESGLLGSAHYVRHPAVPLEQTRLMVNLDMIGRANGARLLVLGAESAAELPDLVSRADVGLGHALQLDGNTYAPSDHLSFQLKEVPVLSFFTGPHQDWHRPTDDVEHINADGAAAAVKLAYRVARSISDAPEGTRLSVLRQRLPANPGDHGGGAVLGCVPDFAASMEGGVLLSGVLEGSPAQRAGLKAGDRITRLGGRAIHNVRDLAFVLREHQGGDVVEIVVVRGEGELTLTATLGAR